MEASPLPTPHPREPGVCQGAAACHLAARTVREGSLRSARHSGTCGLDARPEKGGGLDEAVPDGSQPDLVPERWKALATQPPRQPCLHRRVDFPCRAPVLLNRDPSRWAVAQALGFG